MSNDGILFLIVVIGIIVKAIGAYYMQGAAVKKWYGIKEHIWAICFWLGLPGYLYVIALPDKITQNQNRVIIELMKNKNEESK